LREFAVQEAIYIIRRENSRKTKRKQTETRWRKYYFGWSLGVWNFRRIFVFKMKKQDVFFHRKKLLHRLRTVQHLANFFRKKFGVKCF